MRPVASSRNPSRIRRCRWWLALGVLVAGLVTASNFGTLRLLPPSFRAKSPSYSTASMSILVGMPAESKQTLNPQSPRGLYERALTLGDLAGSPAILASTASFAGIRPSQLAVDEPLWSNLQRTQEWDTGPKRSTQILVEKDPYRITLTDDSQSPIIYVTTQAPTPSGAARVATALTKALSEFVTSSQTAENVPADGRYDVTQLTPVTVHPGTGSELVSFAAFIFLSVFAVWCGAVVALCRLLDEIRNYKLGVKARGSQSRSLRTRPRRNSRRIAHRPGTTEI
jgi:hypothetical protein